MIAILGVGSGTSSPLPIFQTGLFVFLLFSCKNSSYILDIRPLADVCIDLQVFFPIL